MSISTKFAALFESMGINVRRVTQIGSFVHIDSFKKYENKIVDAMTNAGFVVAMVKDGVHLDGFDGYRIVFKLA